jgi:hypothetical protein
MAVVATRPRGSYALARIASLIALAAVVVALLIGAAIILRIYYPHAGGDAVAWVRHAGAWLTSPFHNLVRTGGDRHIWLNWGIAAVIYLIVGGVIARLLRGSRV